MGCHENIGYGKWPKQGSHLGQRCEVLFHYGSERLTGTCIRDDAEAPWETIIRLDCGRVVRSAECQYRPTGPAEKEGDGC